MGSGPAPGERIAIQLSNTTSAAITYTVKVTWYKLFSPGWGILGSEERTVTLQPGESVTLFFYNDYGATHHGIDISP